MLRAIKQAKRVLIIGHQRPDGDCIGAGLALRLVCQKYGVQADFACDSPFPGHFAFLPDAAACFASPCGTYDLCIAVDCADDLRLGKLIGYFNSAADTFNIDHHKTNNRFAKHNRVVADASSTCEVLFDLLQPLGEVSKEVGYYLFVGLSTDTGHFMHSNTSPHVFEVAHALSSLGLNVNEIADNIYRSNTVQKTKLIARAIESMRFFADGKICVMTITTKTLEDCGCVLADTEGLIDYGMMIGSVQVAVCITEQGRAYKVSYRSKSVDVAAAAAVFGGGGHKMAAGCSVCGMYEDVVRKVVKSITDGMDA